MTISQVITDLPTPPSRADSSTFDTRADAFLGALDDLASQINTWAGEANSTAGTVNTDANAAAISETNAATSASNAGVYANQAAAAANYQGAWSAGTYTLGQSVTYNDKFYIVNVASTTGTPGTSSDWTELPDFESLKAISDIVNANTVVAATIYIPAIHDHDGGKALFGATGTSWYNEPLNTATRGATRGFPAAALIVAENDTITIYDATDSSLPMWMVLIKRTTAGSTYPILGPSDTTIESVSMLNGVLYVSGVWLREINFINDNSTFVTTEGTFNRNNLNISERGTYSNAGTIINAARAITSSTAHVEAVTQDSEGNNIVYVGSDGGLDRIYKGAVSSWTDSGGTRDIVGTIGIIGDYVYWSTDNIADRNLYTLAQPVYQDLVDSAYTSTDRKFYAISTESWDSDAMPIHYEATNSQAQDLTQNAIATNRSLSLIKPNPSSWGHGLLATVTDTFTSGWQYGDIRGAWLGSGTAEVLSGTELVTNGDFATGDKTGWTDPNGRWSVVANQAVMAASSAYEPLYQINSTGVTIGKTYTLTFDVIAVTGTGKAELNGTSEGTSPANTLEFTTTGTYTMSRVASENNIRYAFARAAPGATMTIDNISIVQATPDTSYNNNALAVAGSVTMSPVATGADLCCASGFSSTNYLYLPNYGQDVADYANGNYWMLWFKPDVVNDYGILLDNTEIASANGRMVLTVDGSANIEFNIYGNATSLGATNIGVAVADVWYQVVITTDWTGDHKVYLNGVNVVSDTTTLTPPANTNQTLHVGVKYDATEDFKGSLALLRIGAGAPTAEQIKFIYESEKHLFRENAKFKLDSANVSSVSFDKQNNMLYSIAGNTYQVRADGQLVYHEEVATTGTIIEAEDGFVAIGG